VLVAISHDWNELPLDIRPSAICGKTWKLLADESTCPNDGGRMISERNSQTKQTARFNDFASFVVLGSKTTVRLDNRAVQSLHHLPVVNRPNTGEKNGLVVACPRNTESLTAYPKFKRTLS